MSKSFTSLDTFLPPEPAYTPYLDEPTFTPIAATIEEGITCANMKSAQKLEKYITEVNAWMKWAREKIENQRITIVDKQSTIDNLSDEIGKLKGE